MTELKPCPFCGGKASYDNDVGNNDEYFVEWVECQECGIQTPRRRWSNESLTSFWNRRT
jgi:Lar family restriction alleviation protein